MATFFKQCANPYPRPVSYRYDVGWLRQFGRFIFRREVEMHVSNPGGPAHELLGLPAVRPRNQEVRRDIAHLQRVPADIDGRTSSIGRRGFDRSDFELVLLLRRLPMQSESK